MKKNIYLMPRMAVVCMEQATMIADSLGGGGDASENLEKDEEGDVKAATRYNVWDDDWSR